MSVQSYMTFLFQRIFFLYHFSGEFFPHNSEDLVLSQKALAHLLTGTRAMKPIGTCILSSNGNDMVVSVQL